MTAVSRTRALCLCAALALCGCAGAGSDTPRSDWDVVLTGDGGQEVSVSRSRLVPLGNQVYRVWMREALRESRGERPDGEFAALVVQFEFDCGRRRARVLVPGLPEEMLEEWERGGHAAAAEPAWEPAESGTRTEQQMTAFCAYARGRGL
jgi:hypothetical protein